MQLYVAWTHGHGIPPSATTVSITVRRSVRRGGASTGLLLGIRAAGYNYHMGLAAQDGNGQRQLTVSRSSRQGQGAELAAYPTVIEQHPQSREHEDGDRVENDEHVHGIGTQVGGATDADRIRSGVGSTAATFDRHRLGYYLVGEQKRCTNGGRRQPGEEGQGDVEVATLTQLREAGVLNGGVAVQGKHEKRNGTGRYRHYLEGDLSYRRNNPG